MMDKRQVVAGVVLNDQTELTLSDLCNSCSVRRESIVALVQEGILTPITGTGAEYRFSGHAVKRAVKAIRLQQELDLNLAGVAVALDLLEEIDSLRTRLIIHGLI